MFAWCYTCTEVIWTPAGRAQWIPSPSPQPPSHYVSSLGKKRMCWRNCKASTITVPAGHAGMQRNNADMRNMGKKCDTLLDLCVSSLRRGHANLLCIVPILTDDLRRGSDIMLITRAYRNNFIIIPRPFFFARATLEAQLHPPFPSCFPIF